MSVDDIAELVVLGGGPGGYGAAFAAADRGMQVTLVDSETAPGGVCLHRGCIPSKALLHVAKLLNETREAREWGIDFAEPKIQLDRLRQWKSAVVGKLVGGVSELCQRRGVKLIRARGRFTSSTSIALDAAPGAEPPALKQLSFKHAIIATGSVPASPPTLRSTDPRIMDSTAALELPDIPRKLLVVGGGYIGLELGSVYASLGSEVTVVELTEGLLPGVDRDLVRPLLQRLRGRFKSIWLNTKVNGLEPSKTGIKVSLSGEGVPPGETVDRVLVAVGRRPNSQGLGLETTRVQVNERGFIVIDKRQRTADSALYAIGDIAGEPMLAHKATREGKIAVDVIAGEPAEFDHVAVPAVVFTDPEIAWCGLTETEAKAKGIEVSIQRFPWGASGRAQTLGRTEGMTKLIFSTDTGRVLGMGVVGAGAGELIAEGVLAVETAALAEDIASSIHPHPTLSETVMEAAESQLGSATHLYRPRR